MSKYDSTMLKLAKMASINIARKNRISRVNAFIKLMNSKTGKMLFNENESMWMNGPDYIANEYEREVYFLRNKVSMN